MKKTLLSLFALFSIATYSQITVFEDSFDTYDDFIITGIGDWLTLDIDGLDTYSVGSTFTWANIGVPQAFQIFNPSATTPPVTNATNGVGGETENRNFDPRTGSKYAACWASPPSTTGGPTANEDWLISPPIDLTGATGASLSIWVKSMSDSYGLESYRIGVYTGSGTPVSSSDFTVISGLGPLSAPYPNWAERVQSLTAYDGQVIRIGIKCQTSDAYMFMVDDFKVTATTLSNSDFVSSKIAVYPNPVKDILNISSDELEIQSIVLNDINGRMVKSAANLSQINISDLNKGVYFAEITTNEGKSTKKIIKN